MSYINNLEVSENGLSDRQIKIMTDELDRLLEMYPKVTITEITDYKVDAEGKVRGVQGRYNKESKSIEIEQENVKRIIDLERKETIEVRKVNRENLTAKLNEKFKYIDITEKQNNDAVKKRRELFSKDIIEEDFELKEEQILKNLIRHEFGHTLDYQLQIRDYYEMSNFFNNTKPSEIKKEAGFQGCNILEFIAFAFEKSFYSNNATIKLVRDIIDRGAGRRGI